MSPKVSRSRSVGCGSRSFSGDFFERISTGFGDCTLRRVESQREGGTAHHKPKLKTRRLFWIPERNLNSTEQKCKTLYCIKVDVIIDSMKLQKGLEQTSLRLETWNSRGSSDIG